MGNRKLCFAAIALLCACGGDKESSGAPKGKAPPKTVAPAPGPPDPRADLTLVRSMLAEAGRAELRLGGPFIDLGTADQQKYTRGGWRSGWSEPQEVDKASVAELTGKSARLATYLLGPPGAWVMRARSTDGNETLTVKSGKKMLGTLELGETWQTVQLDLPETLDTGRRLFELVRGRDEGTVQVDWIWLAADGAEEPPAWGARVAPLKIGKRLRRALLAPTSLTYSYYLHVPDGGRLIFDYGSLDPVDFVVRAQTMDGDSKELFRGTGRAEWKTAEVDLETYAGQPVRLELATEGEGGRGGWGETGVYVADRSRSEPGKKARNVIMIVMDTTRADVFETFDEDTVVHTPELDSFARKSRSFVAAYNNSNWTKPSVATMLSSLYPETHTATKPESVVPEDVGLLTEHLEKHGFVTAGMTANPVVSDKFGFERGWSQFEVNETGAETLYGEATRWLEERGDEPFFFYIQSIDAHTTYAVPAEYSSRYFKGGYGGPVGQRWTRDDQKNYNDKKLNLKQRDIDWVRALYRGEVTYQDEHIGAFLRTVEKEGLLEDTIVVITNDHGEELHDHGAFGHGWTLYEEMIRAPLIIHYPPAFPVGRDTTPTEHVDLAPTLLEALGLPPMKNVEGRSILPRLRGEPVQEPFYAVATSDNGKASVRVGDLKLTVRDSHGWTDLVDLAKGNESDDLRRELPMAGRLCEIYLAEGLGSPGKAERLDGGAGRKFEAQDAELDAETRKKLEALGYL